MLSGKQFSVDDFRARFDNRNANSEISILIEIFEFQKKYSNFAWYLPIWTEAFQPLNFQLNVSHV